MRKHQLIWLMTILLIAPIFTFGQRNCETMPHLEQLQQMNPLMIRKMMAIEQHTQNYIRNHEHEARAVVTIPVVFHVVYRTSTENISTAQLQTQLDVLNEDFRRLNSDADNTWSQAADSEIEFCLASVDPNGNPTTGITRTSTTVNGFGTNDAVKFNSSGGKDAWPASDYLNFWVCNIGGGILGYAQFPGGAAATDGVVNDYRYTGTIGTATAPFNLGRTATHEVGHWLNLRHIWGDGGCSVDDFVGDTPTSDGPNYGCTPTHVSCNSTDMVQNYMDYSDDACMNLFTAGQKARMQALFAPGGFRASLLNSNGCGTGGGGGGGGSSCASTVSSFPYGEGFEGGVGSWSQALGDDLDWTNRSGGTPSSGTGPSAAAVGSNYMYIEASSPNYPSKVANLESPCFDLSGLTNPEFSFQYHMLGSAVGTLNLQASTDGTSWSTIWTRSADQGSSWNAATVDLSTYSSETQLRLRFNGTTGTSWQGDICVDDISLDGGSGGGGGGGSCSDTEVTLTLVLDNYPSETSWSLTDGSGTTVASGSGYSTAGATVTETFCLADDCYEFTINDSYGDGICCAYGNGSYSLDAGSTNLASGGAFGSSETAQLDIGGGCGGGTCPTIDFNTYTINSYGGTQDNGSSAVQDGGATLFIQNNAWKSISLNYTVTANTVIEFDFGSTIEGEIHGIGFDNDNGISSNLTFKVHGTQNWGITNYDNYSGSSWTSYTIPVGSFYTGSFDRLFFVADHDGGARNGNSFFRNVKIYEGSCGGSRTVAEPVSKILLSSGLEIFPNPVRDELNISLPESDDAVESQVVVYDLVGKAVMRNTVQGSFSKLNVGHLTAGTYLLSVSQNGQTVTERFIVTK